MYVMIYHIFKVWLIFTITCVINVYFQMLNTISDSGLEHIITYIYTFDSIPVNIKSKLLFFSI